MHTAASFFPEYFIPAFYKLIESKGNIFLFAGLQAWDFSQVGPALFPAKHTEFYNTLSWSELQRPLSKTPTYFFPKANISGVLLLIWVQETTS